MPVDRSLPRILLALSLGLVAASAAAAAPTSPTELRATPVACNKVQLGWAASRPGDVPLYGYKVYRNGAFFRWVLLPGTSTYDWNVTGGVTLSYSVLAIDSANNQSAMSEAVNVTTPACADPTPPTVPAGLTASATSCSAIALAWGAATDAGGSGLRGYKVYRGGVFRQQVAAPATSMDDTGLAPSTTYGYTVAAIDNAGNESAQSAQVVRMTPGCSNRAPDADAGPDQLTQTLLAVGFNAAGSSDPDDGIAGYAWTFGDGGSGAGVTASHAYARAGTYTVTLTVTDRGGLSASDAAVVRVTNRPPVAVAGPDATAGVGTPADLSGAASSDPDGTISTYKWSFGDGTSGTGVNASHAYAAVGTYTVTLTVTDDAGAQATDSCTVRVTDIPPPRNPAGWVQRLGGPGADIGQGVAVGSDGGAVVVGRAANGTSTQVQVAKYSATGTQLWARLSSGSGSGEAYGVAVDGSGNVLVTGWFLGAVDLGGGLLSSAGAMDLFVAKYAGADGHHLWSRRVGGILADIGYGVAVDRSGDVVVTGFFTRSADLGGGTIQAMLGGMDTFVAKYAGADGRHRWSRAVGDASDDIGYDVAVDGNGDVVVTGFFKGWMNFGGAPMKSAGSNDVFLAKLGGASGGTVWAKRLGGGLADRGYDVDVDASGNILLAGFFQGTVDLGGGALESAGGSDVFVARYAGATGAHLWSRGVGGPGEDYGYGAALDRDGNAVVTGRFKNTVNFGGGPLAAAGDSDVFLARYAGATGGYVSAVRLGGTGSDVGNGVATDGMRMLVSGSFERSADFGGARLGSAGLSDLFLLSLLP